MYLNDLGFSRRPFPLAVAGTIAIAPLSRVFARDDAVVYEPAEEAELSSEFEADGSSTLGPLTEAAIEEFAAIAPDVLVTNSISGSGSGFDRFINGEIAIANASREISDEEAALARENGIPWYRFPMAYDGITVAVSAENDFVTDLSVEELSQILSADGGVTTWAEVRPEWPAEPIEL